MGLADSSNRMTLGIALVAGVLALGTTFVYLKSAKQQVTAANVAEPGVMVMRVRQDLPANHLIDPDHDLEAVSVPAETFASFARTAVKVSESYALRGRRVFHPLPGGTVLQYSDLIAAEDLDIAAGMVAMSISVDKTALMGGLLVPGDLVDIIVAAPIEAGPSHSTPRKGGATDPEGMFQDMMAAMANSTGQIRQNWRATRVLTSVRVLAIAGRLARSRRQMALDGVAGTIEGDTVTLELSSEDALRLFEKTAAGENPVTLLLRPRAGDATLGPASGVIED